MISDLFNTQLTITKKSIEKSIKHLISNTEAYIDIKHDEYSIECDVILSNAIKNDNIKNIENKLKNYEEKLLAQPYIQQATVFLNNVNSFLIYMTLKINFKLI